MQLLVILSIGICLALALSFASHKALLPYLSRGCQGFRWHRAFPHTDTKDIRLFLNVFGQSFGFRQRHLLKFAPADAILQIYNARNPGGGVDSLELESLACALTKHYNFRLQSAWHPGLTLGELFAMVRGNAP